MTFERLMDWVSIVVNAAILALLLSGCGSPEPAAERYRTIVVMSTDGQRTNLQCARIHLTEGWLVVETESGYSFGLPNHRVEQFEIYKQAPQCAGGGEG